MSNNDSPTPKIITMATLKNKKAITIMGACGGIFVVAILLAKMMGPSKPILQQAPRAEDKNKEIMSAYAVKNKTSEDSWIAKSEPRMAQSEKEIRDLKDQVNKLLAKQGNGDKPANFASTLSSLVAKPSSSSVPSPALPPANDFPAYPTAEKARPTVVPGLLSPGSANGAAGTPGVTPTSFVPGDSGGIRVITNDNEFPPDKKGLVPPQTPEAKEQELKRMNEWMPTGSFMHGLLLSGLDAPTGGQAQSNPHPVLIRVMDNAVLPNRFREMVKECFVVGAGYGDISSERAYIRTENLSCVLKNEKIMDIKVKGYVSGEDGKNGMRGKLVSKEGSIIAKALLAGFASGIGTAYQQSLMTQSVSPLGVTQTVNPDQAFQAGVAGGVSSAANMISKYYIQMAEKTFPIIEVDAGRAVDVVITQGFKISLDTEEKDASEK